MNDKIEIEDWVRHQRFKIVGRVAKILVTEENKTILKVWTDTQLPLQTWEEEHVKLHQKAKKK